MTPDQNVDIRERTIFTRNPISLQALSDGKVPFQWYGVRDLESYYRLAKFKFKPTFSPNKHGGEIQAIGQALSIKDLIRLLHYAAPSKFFGFDESDRINDGLKLYNDPDNARLLRRHQKLPGWKDYELHHKLLVELYTREYEGKGLTTDILVPVIRLRDSGEGYRWVFDPPEAKAVRNKVMYPNTYKAIPQSSFLPILGPLLVAAYSPDVTKEWGELRTFKGVANGTEASHADMGSSQLFPLAIGQAPPS